MDRIIIMTQKLTENKILHIFWFAVKKIVMFDFCGHILVLKSRREVRGGGGGGGGTLAIFGWGCAAGILEPLTYTIATSAEFCYPILD